MSPAPGPQHRPWRPGRGRAASTRGRRRPGDMRARTSTQDTCHIVTDEHDKQGKTALSPTLITPGPQRRPWRPGRGRAASTRGRRRPGDMRARASTQDTCHPVTDERDKRGKTALSPNTNRTRSLASVTRGEDRSGGAGRGPGGSGRASHHHHPHAGSGEGASSEAVARAL